MLLRLPCRQQQMKTRIRYLLGQYFYNRASRGELEEFFRIVNSAKYDDELAAVVKETYEALKREDPSLTYIDPDGKLNRLAPPEDSTPRAKRLVGRRLWVPVMVASLAVVVAAGVWINRERTTAEQTAQTTPVVKQAASDESKVLQLADGTKVWLNSSSELEYPPTFDPSAPREVFLTGEAFFEVEKAADWPFIVHTGEVKTTVLGTAFNVKAYPGMESVSVTVKSGKVSVSRKDKRLATLGSNQELRIPLAEQQVALEERTLSNKVAGSWTSGYLDYEDEALSAIITDLERFYGVSIGLRDPALATERITISIKRDSKPEQPLDILCRLTDKQLLKQGNEYTIY